MRIGVSRLVFAVVLALGILLSTGGLGSAAEDPWVCCKKANGERGFAYLSECKNLASPTPASPDYFTPGLTGEISDGVVTIVYGVADRCGRTVSDIIKRAPVTAEWRLGATWDGVHYPPKPVPNGWPSPFPASSSHTLMSVTKTLVLRSQDPKIELSPGRLYILRLVRSGEDAWSLAIYDQGTGQRLGDLPMASSPDSCGGTATDTLTLSLTKPSGKPTQFHVCWGEKHFAIAMPTTP